MMNYRDWKSLALAGPAIGVPEGYVYVGKGNGTYEGLPFGKVLISDIFGFNDSSGNVGGSLLTASYACPIARWEEVTKLDYKKVMGNKIKNILDIVRDKLTEARKLIGKKVELKNSFIQPWKVEEVRLLLSKDEPGYKPFGGTAKDRFLEQHGYVILLCSGSQLNYGIPFGEHVVEEVKVNGYVGEDKGTHYVFGCAKIPKKVLREARQFLRTNKKGKDAAETATQNRWIESVKIGDGTFTLDILEELCLNETSV